VAYLPTDKDFAYKWRTTKAHADDLSAITAFVASQNDLPIWVLGTSYSGASATNVAASNKSGALTGIVLAAATLYEDPDDPKWAAEAARLRGEYGAEYDNMNIGTANSTGVATKVVLLNNQADKCPTSKLADEADAKALLPNADLKIVHVNGGTAKSNRNWKVEICGGRSEHGFYTIDKQAVSAIDGAIGSFN
jgi:pimeloyl-ACP methyl ester carboxylesterase